MKTSKRIITRLSRYKNVLYKHYSNGMNRVFSDFIAEEVGVTASQVRKDFSLFGLTGNKRAGYRTKDLIDKLEAIFHKSKVEKVVVVGSGRLGSALAHYGGLERQKIEVVATFDNNPEKVDRGAKIPTLPMEELQEFISENRIEIGLLAVPEAVAQSVYESMSKIGFKGVLNFAPIPLKEVEGCLISTYCVEVELENIIYFVKEKGRKKK